MLSGRFLLFSIHNFRNFIRRAEPSLRPSWKQFSSGFTTWTKMACPQNYMSSQRWTCAQICRHQQVELQVHSSRWQWLHIQKLETGWRKTTMVEGVCLKDSCQQQLKGCDHCHEKRTHAHRRGTHQCPQLIAASEDGNSLFQHERSHKNSIFYLIKTKIIREKNCM